MIKRPSRKTMVREIKPGWTCKNMQLSLRRIPVLTFAHSTQSSISANNVHSHDQEEQNGPWEGSSSTPFVVKFSSNRLKCIAVALSLCLCAAHSVYVDSEGPTLASTFEGNFLLQSINCLRNQHPIAQQKPSGATLATIPQ